MSYDQLYQDWRISIEAQEFIEADIIRNEFERLHGLTIIAKGSMPIEGVTTQRMTLAKWHKKYRSLEVKKLHAIHSNDGVHMRPLMAPGEIYG